MKEHEIKLNHRFCDAVYNGVKTFEIRYDDRGYEVGDVVRFVPVDDSGNVTSHEIKYESYVITYILLDWGLSSGYIAFAIKKI